MIILEIYYVVSNVTMCLNSPVEILGVLYKFSIFLYFFLLQPN